MITSEQRGLAFEPLGDMSWRLCDSEAAEHDAGRVVAYIERADDGGYEAIWLGFGVAPSRHPSREDVLRKAHGLRAMNATSTPTKPTPIPHRAPQRIAPTGPG